MIHLIAFFLAFFEPPRTIPAEFRSDFTMNEQIPVRRFYRDDRYPADQPLIYEFDQVESLKKRALEKQENYYGSTDRWLYEALDQFSMEGKEVAIIGSREPWYEAVALSYGAFPTTIEYNRIVSFHPALSAITPKEYEENPRLFDAIFSISSYEHDGLGRYGDPIDPRGDLAAMEKAKGMLKPDGLLFLAVPVGRDLLAWNAHRVYGPIRFPLLTLGWDLVKSFGFAPSDFAQEREDHQPIFVLRKKITERHLQN